MNLNLANKYMWIGFLISVVLIAMKIAKLNSKIIFLAIYCIAQSFDEKY